MTRHLLLAALLCAVHTSAEPLTFRVVVTSLDEDTYLAKPDPAFYLGGGQRYLRTQNCKHQAAEDEPAIIVMGRLSDGTATLFFSPEEVCTVINVSLDRGSL